MIKPNNFNPKKKYPLLIYQYSGPGLQEVFNRWSSNRDSMAPNNKPQKVM